MRKFLKRLSLLSLSLFAVFGLLSPEQRAWAATTTGNAKARIIRAISIANVSDLDFGDVERGAAAQVVAAGAADNASNGSFTVSGEGGKVYTISLPAVAQVITTGAGAVADDKLNVDTFTSFPSGTGTLSGTSPGAGTELLLIGGTLKGFSQDAISAAQSYGDYTGTYSVGVVYQ